jgi:hypothetical protein
LLEYVQRSIQKKKYAGQKLATKILFKHETRWAENLAVHCSLDSKQASQKKYTNLDGAVSI